MCVSLNPGRRRERLNIPMRTLKLTLAYDGTNYVGWQRQINGLSIQQVVEEALAPLVGGERAPTVAGAGRTDAGVHALGQVASVHARYRSRGVGASSARSTSGCRPTFACSAWWMRRPGFHAQFHSTGKAYRYRIATTAVLSPFDRWFVWHAPEPRDRRRRCGARRAQLPRPPRFRVVPGPRARRCATPCGPSSG